MAKCLVLGVNGQDGSFLSEILASSGAQVCGVGLSEKLRYPIPGSSVHYVRGDVRDGQWLRELLERLAPDEIYHFAAVHGAAGFDYEAVWADAVDVNVKALYHCLEYARAAEGRARVFYPSSAKVFGAPLPAIVSLETPRQVTCLYSNNKLSAENLLKYYRDQHGVHAVLAYLFNHESTRRDANYFIPQVIDILQHALRNRSFTGELYTLDFYCDWGCAREYMGMAIEQLRLAQACDLIFATGVTHHARAFVSDLFGDHGLNYADHVRESCPNTGATGSVVDISATVSALGRSPRRTIFDVCVDMLTAKAN